MSSLIEKFRIKNKGRSDQELVNQYFILMENLQNAKKQKDYSKFIQYCMMTLGLIEPFIRDTKKTFGNFVVSSIPAIEEVLPHYAVLGQVGQIENVKEVVEYFPELSPWKNNVEKALEMKILASKIYDYVKENPGTLQKHLKKKLDYNDGRLISNVIYYMEIHKKIQRKKTDNSYELTIIKL